MTRHPNNTALQAVVYVIDDHPIVSFGLVELVKDLAPCARTRQFSNLRDAAQRAVREFPTLIISDFHLNDVRGDAFVGLFETLFPGVPVLVSSNDQEVMGHLKRHNAQRFTAFSKLTPFPRLMEYIRSGLSDAGIDTVHAPDVPIKGLTQKQTQVLELIGVGYSNRDIAESLGISIETVKGHVKDILERLHAKNRMEATLIHRHSLLQSTQLAEAL